VARLLKYLLVALALWASSASASSTLRPLFSKRGSYGESFTFIADLGADGYVQLSIGVTNLGPGPTKGLCRAIVSRPQVSPWRASTRVARDAVNWVDGNEERLTVGSCSTWIDSSRTGAEVHLDGGTIRLTFKERALPRFPHNEVIPIGGERYQTQILLYRTPVDAELSLPGQPAHTASGQGYCDHTRSTVKPKNLAKSWIRFRALRGRRGLIVLGRQGFDDQFAPLWACQDTTHCRDYQSFRIEREKTEGSPRFRIQVQAATQDGIDIRSGQPLYRDAPLEDLGLVGKLAKPFVGSNVTYVYRGSATIGTGSPIEGVLEVEMAE